MHCKSLKDGCDLSRAYRFDVVTRDACRWTERVVFELHSESEFNSETEVNPSRQTTMQTAFSGISVVLFAVACSGLCMVVLRSQG